MSDDTGDRVRPHVVVVGAGIAGLAAAWFLRQDAPEVAVTVLEGAPRTGGKLRVSELAGVPADEGAEAMLARRPEGVDLARALGLGDDLVSPGTSGAAVWTDRLRPMPGGHVTGVPGDLDALRASGLLSPDGLAAVAADGTDPAAPVGTDVAVGAYVTARMGAEVVDRLVEPLLGGVYAGRADRLSLWATVPQLAAPLATDGSLLAAARAVTSRAGARRGTAPAPVFASLRGGLGRLPDALVAALGSAGVTVRTGATVRELRRRPAGWSLTVGPTRAEERVDADAVVLALPARPAGRLLGGAGGAAARAGADLAAVDYASLALASFAYPATAFTEPLTGTGFLVPSSYGRAIKAATYLSRKWAYLTEPGYAGPDTVIVRCSLGRYGEERTLQRDDADLLDLAAADLAAATGVQDRPVAARLTRWGGALPQYEVGHLDRVARVRAAVAAEPGLAVCGAAYDGVGVPACVASARTAADRVLATLRDARESEPWSTASRPAN